MPRHAVTPQLAHEAPSLDTTADEPTQSELQRACSHTDALFEFRNWFRADYPYAYSAFRLARR